MPTTIRDIAKTLNVSHTTVSRVLNGRGGEFISVETQRRVQDAAQRMNYRPNRAARALASGRTGLIALWIGDPVYPYYGSVLHHVETLLDRHELDLLYVPIKRINRYGEDRATVDGILALDHSEAVEEYLTRSERATLPPIVNMGHYVTERADTVFIDLGAGAWEAVTHLLNTGRERIAFICSGRGQQAGDPRREAYRAAMEAAGRTPEFVDVDVQYNQDVRPFIHKRIAARFQNGGEIPDALFCFSDEIAMGAYRGVRDAGKRVPDEVAIIGCDGIGDLAYFDPPISAIAQPYAAMCDEAWRLLQRRMAKPESAKEQAILMPKLILRESSAGKPP